MQQSSTKIYRRFYGTPTIGLHSYWSGEITGNSLTVEKPKIVQYVFLLFLEDFSKPVYSNTLKIAIQRRIVETFKE